MQATRPISPKWFHALWSIPLGLGLILSIGFYQFDWDHQLLNPFYSDTNGFHHSEDAWILWIYHFAGLPGLLIAISSLLAWITSIWLTSFRTRNRLFAYFSLSLIIGPGILVNALGKDHYGRPRPRQTIEYGGEYTYLKLGVIGPHKDGRSFPSGHASVAFFMLAPGFIFLAYRRFLGAGLIFILGLSWGTLVGSARMLVGAHWPSDVLWSALCVWMTCFLLAYALGFLKVASTEKDPL